MDTTENVKAWNKQTLLSCLIWCQKRVRGLHETL